MRINISALHSNDWIGVMDVILDTLFNWILVTKSILHQFLPFNPTSYEQKSILRMLVISNFFKRSYRIGFSDCSYCLIDIVVYLLERKNNKKS